MIENTWSVNRYHMKKEINKDIKMV